jgi:hypothetical protein
MRKYIQLICILMFTGVALSLLGGCSVNVIVAPHATLSLDSDLSTNPYLYQEASPLYDCVAGPDADVCQ